MSTLEGIDFSGFDLVGKNQEAKDAPPGGQTEIPLDRIIEDPDQPRRRFDKATIEEMAASIKKHGILQPIVVRPKDDSGKHRIVMGARRFRAARLAKLERVPAVIRVEPTDGYDQMVENIQRENLLHADIAHFIETELAKGIKATTVAASLGKPRSWVSLYSGFSKMHEAIRDRVEDFGIRAAYELQKAMEIDERATLEFMNASEAITQRDAIAFAKELRSPAKPGTEPAEGGEDARERLGAGLSSLSEAPEDETVAPSGSRKASAAAVAIFVQVSDRVGRLMTDRVAEKGSQYGVVSFDHGADIQEISVKKMKLMEIISPE